jgi:hypothetical protein
MTGVPISFNASKSHLFKQTILLFPAMAFFCCSLFIEMTIGDKLFDESKCDSATGDNIGPWNSNRWPTQNLHIASIVAE